jgi:hypothetical protein
MPEIPAVIAHIEALQEQLYEATLEEDAERGLEIAILLIDLYENILEESGMLLVHRYEVMH